MGVDGSIYLGLSLKMGLFFEAKLIFHQSKLGIWHMKNEYCMFFYWITYFLHQIEVRQSACWFFLSLEPDNFTKCWSFLGQSLVQIPKSYQALLIRPLLSRTFMSFWNSTMTPSPRPTGARVFPGGPGPTCRRRRTHTAPADTAVASLSPPTSRSLADGFVGCSWGHHLRVCAYMINK